MSVSKPNLPISTIVMSLRAMGLTVEDISYATHVAMATVSRAQRVDISEKSQEPLRILYDVLCPLQDSLPFNFIGKWFKNPDPALENAVPIDIYAGGDRETILKTIAAFKGY